MEGEPVSNLVSDLQGKVVRPPSLRVSGSFNSALSGRFTPRGSPSLRKSSSLRTPARETRPVTPIRFYCRLLSRRLLPWLIVIGLWGYIGLLVQSRWAHNDGRAEHVFGGRVRDHDLRSHLNAKQKLMKAAGWDRELVRDTISVDGISGNEYIHSNASKQIASFGFSGLKNPWSSKAKQVNASDEANTVLALQNEDEVLKGAASITERKGKEILRTDQNRSSWIFPAVGAVNDSVGMLVGPFDELERKVLGRSIARGRPNVCNREEMFADSVRGKRFMLLLHELSMTGSPLAMMELATEILNCGGKVTALALNQKGGLLQELLARGIKVLKNKASLAFRTAAKVDLLVAGSAVCASWIDKYLLFNKKGSKRLVWWIMENRREYFDRSKHLLSKAKVLMFLSESQLKQWQTWSQLEGIVFPDIIKVVPLCVNGEISKKAGLSDSKENVVDMKKQLRELVRAQMGLESKDVLLTTLSSINPGKGQLKLLQALSIVAEELERQYLRADSLQLDLNNVGGTRDVQQDRYETLEGRSLKLLIGSVGSKSNKVNYSRRLLDYMNEHPHLAKLVLWTPATVRVAPLYAASDAYVMNSQGLGETFGRVTIEAMAFALPILGTDAGGTSEIVEHNVSGMLHPVGANGVSVLAQHIKVILENATFREEMGLKGREKVKLKYLKEILYEKLAEIFIEAVQ